MDFGNSKNNQGWKFDQLRQLQLAISYFTGIFSRDELTILKRQNCA